LDCIEESQGKYDLNPVIRSGAGEALDFTALRSIWRYPDD